MSSHPDQHLSQSEKKKSTTGGQSCKKDNKGKGEGGEGGRGGRTKGTKRGRRKERLLTIISGHINPIYRFKMCYVTAILFHLPEQSVFSWEAKLSSWSTESEEKARYIMGFPIVIRL